MPVSAAAPQRILIVRLSHLGDVVLALPVFHALRERYARAEIAWVVQPEFAPLLAGLPGLARVIRFERRGGLRAWLALRAELAAFAPDLAVDAQGNLKSGFALACSGATRRVGLAKRDWRERAGSFAVTESCAAVERGREHAMERTLALCEHLTGRAELRRDPACSEVELSLARGEFERRVGSGESVLVQLSSAGDVRSWPVANCEELARSLTRDDKRVLVLSGPAEAREGAELEAKTRDEPRIGHWVAQRGLRELAAFFTVAARRGASYVGCDTGPTHLASACGLPVTILCGPQTHLRTGPWPVAQPSPFGASPHSSVRASEPPECAPCFARECRHARGPVCMSSITSEQVLAAIRAPRALSG